MCSPGDPIERTRIGRLLAGFRDRKPADRKAITTALNDLSQMIADFRCIVLMDINPLLADAERAIALDARIEIDPAVVKQEGSNPALAIRPHPPGWEKEFSGDGFRIRPIEPADIALYPDFLAKVSPDDIRLRFLASRKNFPDEMLKRLTQLDYDRDMAFVALDGATGTLAGVGRLWCDTDRTVGEYARLVRTDLQGRGIGWQLLQQIVAYAKAEGIGRIEGIVLDENARMLAMCRAFGFAIAPKGGRARADARHPRSWLNRPRIESIVVEISEAASNRSQLMTSLGHGTVFILFVPAVLVAAIAGGIGPRGICAGALHRRQLSVGRNQFDVQRPRLYRAGVSGTALFAIVVSSAS
jgi:RimJ/RimL family protein N-acetyltransferase